MMTRGSAVALAAGAMLSWGCSGEQAARSAPAAPAVSRPAGEDPGPSPAGAFRLRLERLAVERDRSASPPGPLPRNPFRFGASSRQSVSVSPPYFEEAVGWSDPPPPDPLAWSEPAGAWSTPPLVFIGIIEAPASAGRVAVLTDGEAVYHGRVGDVLGAYARIVSITPPSVELEPAGGARYTLVMEP